MNGAAKNTPRGSEIPLHAGYTMAAAHAIRATQTDSGGELERAGHILGQTAAVPWGSEGSGRGGWCLLSPSLSGLSSSSGCGQSPTWRGPRLPRPGNCSCQRCRDAKRREWVSGFWGTPCEHDTVRTERREPLLSGGYRTSQVSGPTVWESVFSALYLWTLTLRISLKVGLSVFFFTDVFLFPRLALSGTR